MIKALVTYSVNGSTQHDWLTGESMSTQLTEGGNTMVVFPKEDGTLSPTEDGPVQFDKVRAVHYAEADRIVKMAA